MYAEPSLIYAICDEAGNVLYSYAPERKRVMREGNAYILTSMLESAVQTGTGHRLGELDIPLAGKTGTTGDENGNRDIWMAAYNPQYAAAVWMGYDSEEQGRLPDAATGGTYPALMLREVFETLYPDGDRAGFCHAAGCARIPARRLYARYGACGGARQRPDAGRRGVFGGVPRRHGAGRLHRLLAHPRAAASQFRSPRRATRS